MTRLLTILIVLFLSSFALHADDGSGYEIKVKIDGFAEKDLYLGYHYGEKQYLKDTVQVGKDGFFTFSGDETLDCGVYLVVMPPNNKYIQLLIKDEQQFTVQTSLADPVKDIVVKGSKENQNFYEYLKLLNTNRPKAEALQKGREAAKEAGEPEKVIADLTKKLEKLDGEVKAFQKNFVKKNEGTLAGGIVKAGLELNIPEMEDQTQKYLYAKEHWFDNIDVTDPCMLRSPVLFNKFDYYLEKLTPRHPDSIGVSLDRIMEMARPNEEVFKFCLIHFLNKYAKSKIVGYDAVYVHIVEKYYATGQAPWTEEEQLGKIVDNAEKLKPILIGKTAPEIAVPELDIEGTIAAKDVESEHKRFKLKEKISLHGVDSPITVLFIWSPDCGHCKKSMPKMVEFYDAYKDKGVEMYALCHRNYKETPSCAEFIEERPGMLKWINVTDPYFRSRYHDLYDVKSTPQIYILDEKKEIVSKRIGAEQLGDVIDNILEVKAKQKEKEGKSE